VANWQLNETPHNLQVQVVSGLWAITPGLKNTCFVSFRTVRNHERHPARATNSESASRHDTFAIIHLSSSNCHPPPILRIHLLFGPTVGQRLLRFLRSLRPAAPRLLQMDVWLARVWNRCQKDSKLLEIPPFFSFLALFPEYPTIQNDVLENSVDTRANAVHLTLKKK